MQFLELLKSRIALFDGAMGTEILKRIKKEDELPGDFLNITHPELIKEIHRLYIEAGADVIETNTFNSNPLTLKEFSKEGYLKELNEKGVYIAREAVKDSGKKIFVCGSIGPGNISLSLGSRYSFDDVKLAYIEQIEALFKAGVDFVIFETSSDMINLKAGVIAMYEVFGDVKLPAICSITLNSNGLMLSGHNIEAAYSNLQHFNLLAIGINCSTGPVEMASSVKRLSEISNLPVMVMPNAGFLDDKGNYTLKPEDFATTLYGYASSGFVNIVGGCCGTTPEHIKALRDIKQLKPRELKKEKKFSVSHKIAIFSDDIEKPFIVAERLNTLGSKKFKEMVINSNEQGIVTLLKEQVLKGAHIVDVSFVNPERDEKEDIKRFLPLISSNTRIPIMIDSTNLDSFELSLKITGSKLILNSINFENGEEKAYKALELQKKYGCIIVSGLIDESKNMPFEFNRKMEIFQKQVDFFKRNGFDLSNIIFDPLVFPIATVSYKRAAYDTLMAVREISKLGFKTILGISNVSFGLPPSTRKYINSYYLYIAIKYGLDFAIVNVMEKIPYALIDDELKNILSDILDGNTDLVKLLVEKTGGKKERISDDLLKLSNEELLKKSIMEGISNVENTVVELLKNYTGEEIINNIVIPQMNEVGDKFSKGEYIVTEVLACAGVAQKIMDILKPYLKKEYLKRGKIVIATVKGDVHDIGKNLVSMIFESNGFEVVDLGTKVDAEVIVESVKKLKPDFIGLSGLLARSCEYMVETAVKLKDAGIDLPLLVGGAALTEKFVENKIKPVYKNVFYSKDALSALRFCIEWKRH